MYALVNVLAVAICICSPDGSERVLWLRSKIMSSISPISRTFFRRHNRFERNRNGFLRPLLMLVLLLLNDVAPDVGIKEATLGI